LNTDAPSYRPGSAASNAAHRVAVVHPSWSQLDRGYAYRTA
jgi:hypothetical protein